MVGAAGKVFVPSPFVFERDELVDIRFAVDDALFVGADTREASIYFGVGLANWRGIGQIIEHGAGEHALRCG